MRSLDDGVERRELNHCDKQHGFLVSLSFGFESSLNLESECSKVCMHWDFLLPVGLGRPC